MHRKIIMASVQKKQGKSLINESRKNRNTGSNVNEKIVELDTLRSFTIPKTKKSSNELLERVAEGSVEYQHEIMYVLERNCKDPESMNRMSITGAHLVRNSRLLDQFVEKKKQMRQDHNEKELQDCYAFLYTKVEKEMKKICSDGLLVGNSTLSCIGNPKMGVLLCKFADVFQPAPVRAGQTGFLIIFKIIKGKIKYTVENRTGEPLDPAPGFDCHMSKSVAIDLQTLTPQEAYESTQIFLYEYDEEMELIDRPRHIYPYAVVAVKFNVLDKTPMRRKLSVHSSVSKGAGTKAASISDGESTASPHKKKLKPSNNPSGSINSSQPVISAAVTAGCEGIVVWRGPLNFKLQTLCEVELLAGMTPDYRLFHFGQALDLDNRVPHATLAKQYHLDQIGILDCSGRQCIINGMLYSYCRLRPVDRDAYSFGQVALGMVQWECGSVMQLSKDAHLVILSDCNITQTLGLSAAISKSSPQILHCILTSAQPSTEIQCGSSWNTDSQSDTGWSFGESQWLGSLAGSNSSNLALAGAATCWPPSLQMEIMSGKAVGPDGAIAKQSAEGLQIATGQYASLEQRLNLMIAEEDRKGVDSCMAGVCSPLSGHASDNESSASLDSSSSDDDISEYSDSLSDNELDIIQLKKTPSALLRSSSADTPTLASNKYTAISSKSEKSNSTPFYRPTRLNRTSKMPLQRETVESDDSDDSKDNEDDDDDSEDSNLSEDLIDQIVRMNPLKSGVNPLLNAGSLLLNTLLDSIPSLRSKPAHEIARTTSSPSLPKSDALVPPSKNGDEVVSDALSGVVPLEVAPVVSDVVQSIVSLPQVLTTHVLPTVNEKTAVNHTIAKIEKAGAMIEPLTINDPSETHTVAIKTEIMSPGISLPQSPMDFESIISRVISGSTGLVSLPNGSESTVTSVALPISVNFGPGYTSGTAAVLKSEASEELSRSRSKSIEADQQLSSSNDATEKSDSDDCSWLSQIIRLQSSIRFAEPTVDKPNDTESAIGRTVSPSVELAPSKKTVVPCTILEDACPSMSNPASSIQASLLRHSSLRYNDSPEFYPELALEKSVEKSDLLSAERELLISQCVHSVIHRNTTTHRVTVSADEETEEARRRCMVHIGLHYMLPLGCQTHEEVRELRTKTSAGTNTWIAQSAPFRSTVYPLCAWQDMEKFYSIYNQHSCPVELLDALNGLEFESLSVKPVFRHLEGVSLSNDWHFSQEKSSAAIQRCIDSSLPVLLTESPASPPPQETIRNQSFCCLRGITSTPRISRWPDSLFVVDVPVQLPRYRPNWSCGLPELISVQYDAVRDPRISVSRLPTSVYVKPLRPMSADIVQVSGVKKADTDVASNFIEAAKNVSIHIRMNQQCSTFSDARLTRSAERSLSAETLKSSVVSDLGDSSAANQSLENSLQLKTLTDKPAVHEPVAKEYCLSETMPTHIGSESLQLSPRCGVVIKQEIVRSLEACGNELPDIQATEALLNQVIASRAQGQSVRQVPPPKSTKEDRPKHLAGISPDVLKRRLERIEAKLSAIRSKSRVSCSSSSKDAAMSFKQMESKAFDTEVKNLIASCVVPSEEPPSMRSQSTGNDTQINQQVAVAEHSSANVELSERSMLPDTTTTASQSTALDPKRQLLSPNVRACSAKPLVEHKYHLVSDEVLKYPAVALNKKSTTADSPDSTIVELTDSTLDILSNKLSSCGKTKVSQTLELDESQPIQGDVSASKVGDIESVMSSHLALSCSFIKGHSSAGLLSVETQWDSESFDSRQVRDTHEEFISGWESSKPLDQLVPSQLSDQQVEQNGDPSSQSSASTADSVLREVQCRLGEISNIATSTDEPTKNCNTVKDKISESCVDDELVDVQNSNVAAVYCGVVSDISDDDNNGDITYKMRKKENQPTASDQSLMVVSSAFSGLRDNLEIIRNSVCTEDGSRNFSKQLSSVYEENHQEILKTAPDFRGVMHESSDSSNSAKKEPYGSFLTDGLVVKRPTSPCKVEREKLPVDVAKKQAVLRDNETRKQTTAKNAIEKITDCSKSGEEDNEVFDDNLKPEKEKKSSKKSHKQRDSGKEHRKHKKKKRHIRDYEAQYLEANADNSKVRSIFDTSAKSSHIKRSKIDQNKLCQTIEPSDEEVSDTVLQCFVSGDVDLKALSRIPDIADNVRNFHSRSLTLQTSFFWAVALAVLDQFVDDPEPPSVPNDPVSKDVMEYQQDEEILCKPSKSNHSMENVSDKYVTELSMASEISATRPLVKSAPTESSVLSALDEVRSHFFDLYQLVGLNDMKATAHCQSSISFKPRLHHLNVLSFSIDDSNDPVVLPGIHKFECEERLIKADHDERALFAEQKETIPDSHGKSARLDSRKNSQHSITEEMVIHANTKSNNSVTPEDALALKNNSAKRSKSENVSYSRAEKTSTLSISDSSSAYGHDKCDRVERQQHVESQKRRHSSDKSVCDAKQHADERKRDTGTTSLCDSGKGSSKISKSELKSQSDKHSKPAAYSPRRSEEPDREKTKRISKDSEDRDTSHHSSPKKLKIVHSIVDACDTLNIAPETSGCGSKKLERSASDRTESVLNESFQCVPVPFSTVSEMSCQSTVGKGCTDFKNVAPSEAVITERRVRELLELDSVVTTLKTTSSSNRGRVSISGSSSHYPSRSCSNSTITDRSGPGIIDSKSSVTRAESEDEQIKSRHVPVSQKKSGDITLDASRSTTDHSATKISSRLDSEMREKNLESWFSSLCRNDPKGTTPASGSNETKRSDAMLSKSSDGSDKRPCVLSFPMDDLMDSSSEALSSALRNSSCLESNNQEINLGTCNFTDETSTKSTPATGVEEKLRKGSMIPHDDKRHKRISDDGHGHLEDDAKKRKISELSHVNEVSEKKSGGSGVERTVNSTENSKPSLLKNVISAQSSCTDDFTLKEKLPSAAMLSNEQPPSITEQAGCAVNCSNEIVGSPLRDVVSVLERQISPTAVDGGMCHSGAGDSFMRSPTSSPAPDKADNQENKSPSKSAVLCSSADSMKFMQTFRRSQIAKRRSQRLSQQTATGGKMLQTASILCQSPVATLGMKQKIGLTLEETLAQISSTSPTAVTPQRGRSSVPLVAAMANETCTSWLRPVDTDLITTTSTATDMDLSPCSTPCEMEPTIAASGECYQTNPTAQGVLCVSSSVDQMPSFNAGSETPVRYDYSQYSMSAESSVTVSWAGNYNSGSYTTSEPFGYVDQQVFGYEQHMWSTGWQPPAPCHGSEFSNQCNQMQDLWQVPPPPPVSVPQDAQLAAEASPGNVSSTWESPLPPPPLPPLTLFPQGNLNDAGSATVNIPPLMSISPCISVPNMAPAIVPNIPPVHQTPATCSSIPSAHASSAAAAAVKSPLIPTLPTQVKPLLSLPLAGGDDFPRIRRPLPAPPKLPPLLKSKSKSPLRGSLPKLMELSLPCPVPDPNKASIIRRRFYVLECNQVICETAKMFLLASMPLFDPYNASILRYVPYTGCLVFVHAADIDAVDRIPGLLLLKRNVNVTFVLFETMDDILNKTVTPIFPRAGLVVIHTETLLACKPETLDIICTFMLRETNEKNTRWQLMLSSAVMKKLRSGPYPHYSKLVDLVQRFQTLKVIDFLPENLCRGRPSTIEDYRRCCVVLQSRCVHKFRHFLFMIDVSRDSRVTCLFTPSGIEVMNGQEFLQVFKNSNLPDHELLSPTVMKWEPCLYSDAALSGGSEAISTSVQPPAHQHP